MQTFINILISSFLFVLIAFSMRTIYQTLNFFHIAHAVSLTLGAYLTYTFSIKVGFPLWVAVPVAVVGVVGLMLLLNRVVYQPLQQLKVENWQMLIVSLGAYVILQNGISMLWGDSTLSFRTWEVKQGHQFLGAYITDVQIITIAASMLLLLLSGWFMEKTVIGQEIKAVSSNPDLSELLGVSKSKATMWSVVLGSALAACAGILIAADTDMTPTMGFNWLLYAVVAMIIGGMGKVRYLLLGALLLATAQHLAAYYLDSKWMNATAYIILIVFLFFRPYGFSGKRLRKAEI